jgi:hypothetical protein
MTHVRSRFLFAASLCMAAAFAIAGCGGSDSKPSTGSDALIVVGHDGSSAGQQDAAVAVVPDAAVPADANVIPTDSATPDAATDARPTLPTNAVPAPWVSEDIGAVGVKGGAGRTGQGANAPGRFHVQGSGGDIFGASDQGQFLHRPITGDFDFVGRVVALERTNENTKAGLMVRDSTAPDARNVFMLVHPPVVAGGTGMSKGTRLQFRDKRVDEITSYGDLGMVRSDAPDGPPIWLRLVRKAALFTGFISADGVNWIKDGEVTIATMPPLLELGMAVTSHANEDTALAVFEGVRITNITDPAWADAEIGTLGAHVTGAPARFTVEAANRGMQNTRDGLSFVHRLIPFIGDVEVTAHVTALSSAGNETLRAGVVLRNGLDQGDRMAGFVVELGPNGQRYIIQRRGADDGNITTTAPPAPPGPDGGVADATPPDAAAPSGDAGTDGPPPRGALVPTWVKLVRVGNRFVGFTSTDGRRFEAQVDVTGFVIATNAYAGVIVTSGSEAAPASGVLENVTVVSPPVTPLPLLPDAAAPPDTGGSDAGTDGSSGGGG